MVILITITTTLAIITSNTDVIAPKRRQSARGKFVLLPIKREQLYCCV